MRVVAAVITLLFFLSASYAHEGERAPDGCHYCWTNCTHHGLTYQHRHAHDGNSNDVCEIKLGPIDGKQHITARLLTSQSTGLVAYVYDGDTINVNKQKIRLLDINTEESVHEDKSRNTAFGKQTSNYLKQKLTGQEVSLECFGNDRYYRKLCYVFQGDENINIHMVRQGWSEYLPWHDSPKRYEQSFNAAQAQAKSSRAGLWQSKQEVSNDESNNQVVR